jgi:hypothetical protein
MINHWGIGAGQGFRISLSVQALEADIRAWIAACNDDPKPFVWKKTAEEILDSLARYLQRISGGGSRAVHQ